MEQPFNVGDRVVCITDVTFRPRICGEIMPNKGDILTVRTIEFEDGTWWCRFEEIVNPINYYLEGVCEPVFLYSRFRKIEPRSFTNELTKELAEKGMVVGDGIEIMEPQIQTS